MAKQDITKKDEKLNIWVTPYLHEKIYKAAQNVGMNKSEYVRYILRKELDK